MSETESVLALFADVEPLQQHEGPIPVVRIAYPPDFTAVMDLFRRVLVSGKPISSDYDARVLALMGRSLIISMLYCMCTKAFGHQCIQAEDEGIGMSLAS
eukprot:4436957-Pleurochrysis_carterae.AAC.3